MESASKFSKVAIVTGAASGIGRSVTERFVREGIQVVAVDRDASLAETTGVLPVVCDITDETLVSSCVNDTIKQFSRIDVLVNCAGICIYETIEQSKPTNWRATFETNLDAMYSLVRSVVPHMISRGYGRIVNISSTQSLAAESAVGAYAATKGAINAWSRALAVDLAPHGILVNVVAPGCIHTKMSFVHGVDETTTDLFQEWYVRHRKIPLARPGLSEEVASAVYFLSGSECSYITGHTLVVDGGLTATF